MILLEFIGKEQCLVDENGSFSAVLGRSDAFLLHYYLSQVKVPILAMRGGSDLQTYVDMLVPSNAKLTLIRV